MYYKFSGDFRPKAMIFGNKAYINYDLKIVTDKATGQSTEQTGTWKDTITNIEKIELFGAGGTLLDSMELEDGASEKTHLPIDQRIQKYNDEFRALKNQQQFVLVGKTSYEGMVLEKMGSIIEFELVSKSNRTKVVNAKFDFETGELFTQGPDDTVVFKAFKIDAVKGGSSPISLAPIKDLIVTPPNKSKDELEQERIEAERKKKEAEDNASEEEKRKKDEENRIEAERRRKELEADKKMGKEVYNIIMNNPDLKKAFFSQPTLLGMIKAGDPVGIVPANKLVRNYLGRGTEKRLGLNAKKFPVNSTITFEVVGKDMVIPDADNFTLPVGKTYKAIVRQREIGVDYIQLIHKKDEIDPEFFINIYQQTDKTDIEDDIYPAKIKIEHLSSGQQRYTYPPSEMGRIRVTNYKFK